VKIQDQIIKHEPYTIDLLNYEIVDSLNRKVLPPTRFCGKRIRADKRKLKNIKSREQRLQKRGYSVMMFAS
jgi:hypothetical protein